MGVCAAATTTQGNALRHLKALGFSSEDIALCKSNGYSAVDVYEILDEWITDGLTTEQYAKDTFAEAYPEAFGQSAQLAESGQADLVYNKDDKPKCVISNFLAVMKQDPYYANIKYNEVRGKAEVHVIKDGKLDIVPWSDADEAQSMNYIEGTYGLYSKDKHTSALRILFNERTYNPIREIVDGIKWDGEPRCRHFLSKWGKVEDTPYTQEVSRLIFAGGIHRLYEPGCKFEDVPILMGDQGCGKSTLIRFLAINDDYFGELKVMEGQQAIEDLSGKWVMEIPEMSAFTKAKDQEAIKAFVSRQRDSYRKPYDRNTTELYRRCFFLASSNDRSPLVDKTGNRRWYPVELKSNGYEVFDHEQEIREYIMQCWAEAREKLHDKEMQPFADRALTEYFLKAQENAMQDDWRTGAVADFLDRKLPGELTCVREVCHRALSPNPDFPKEPTLVESKDIGKIIDRLKEWERVGVRKIGNYGKQACWRKRDDAPLPTNEEPFTEDYEEHLPL